VTIFRWDSNHNVRAAESRTAQPRAAAAGEIGIAAPAVDIYEVARQA
jgi:hypothetical protein